MSPARLDGHPVRPGRSRQRTRSPRNTGPSTQARTVRGAPSSPTTGHRAAVAQPGRADQRLLQGGLAPGAVRPRRPPRRRAAAASGRRRRRRRPSACSRIPVRWSSTPPRSPTEPSPVTTVTARAERRASRAESRWASSGPGDHQGDARSRARGAARPAGTAAPPRARDRRARSSPAPWAARTAGPAARSPRAGARRAAPASQRVPGADHLDDDLEGQPVAAGRRDPVHPERPAPQAHRAAVAAVAPTESATKVPGRNRSAMPGATRVRWWKAPTLRLASTVAGDVQGPVTVGSSRARAPARRGQRGPP